MVGFINIDTLPGTDQEKIEAGIALFLEDKNRQYRGIVFNEPKTITRTLEIPNYMVFQGTGDSYRFGKDANLIIEIDDIHSPAIRLTGDRGAYVSEHTIKNLFISVSGRVQSVIDCQNGTGQLIENVTIKGENRAAIGVRIGTNADVARATNNRISSLVVLECGTGLLYDNCGHNHFSKELNIRRCGTGVSVNRAASVYIEDSLIEDNSVAVYANQCQRLSIERTAFENGKMHLNGVQFFDFKQNKHSGYPFEVSDCESLNFENNRIDKPVFRIGKGDLPDLIFTGNLIQKQEFIDEIGVLFKEKNASISRNKIQ